MLLRYDNDKPMLMQGSSFPTSERRDGDVNGQADPQSCRAGCVGRLWCGSGEEGVEGQREIH